MRSFGYPSGEIVITVFAITAIVGVVHSLLRAKHLKRFPMSTNVYGTILQVIAILALLIPKLFLMGKAVVHAPYCYPLIVFIEFLLISIYNYTIFRSFEFFYSTSTALIVPAFFQSPINAKTAYTTKIWKIRSALGSYANTPHSAILYIISAILIYAPSAVIIQISCNILLYHNYFPLLNFAEEWDFWKILGMYVAGFIVYIPASIMYYHDGHNWRLIIKTKHAKNSYMNRRLYQTIMKPGSRVPKRSNNNRHKAESFELGIEPSITNK